MLRAELVAMGFAAAAPGIVFGLTGLTDPESVTTDVDVIRLVAGVLASFGPAVLVVYLLWRDGCLQLAGFRRPKGWSFAIYSLLATIGAFVAVLAAATVLAIFAAAAGLDPPSEADPPVVELTVRSLLVAFTLSATAALSEEAVWRGYAITRMEQAGWPRAALVVPLALWTLQHLYAGPIALLIVGAVGIPWVWIFRWQRVVWPIMVGHFVYDFVLFLLDLLSTS